MSGQTSQPNLNSIVAALEHTRRATGLDMDALNQCADYWEVVREFYAPFDTGPKSGSAEVYLHEMPGGQYTNLKEQAESMGLGARWHELARAYADVNLAFGDIVKVTPSSKVVGDMALFLVNHNMTMEQFGFLTPEHNLTLPSSVIEMFMGSLGEPEGGWPKKLQAIILRGAKPHKGRPGAHLPKVDLEDTAAALEKKIGRRPARDEVLSYLMYPEVFVKFAHNRQAWGDVDVLPTPQFYYGMERSTDVAVELEAGQDAGGEVSDRGRAASRRHAHGFLRAQRPAPRSHRPRSQPGREAAGGPESRSQPAGPDRRSHSRRGIDRCRADEPGDSKRRSPAGDGSDENAEHGLRSGRRQGVAGSGSARPARGVQGPAAGD
jgi:pyruvate carboxylase